MTKGTDIATTTTHSVMAPTVLDALEAALKDPTADFSWPEGTGAGPADDMLQAESLDELNAIASQTNALSMEAVADKNVRVLSFKVLKSDFEGEGLPFFLLASAEVQGKLELVIVGGRTPVAYLVRRARLGGLPMDADEALVFTRATEKTAAGYYPWNVERRKVTDQGF